MSITFNINNISQNPLFLPLSSSFTVTPEVFDNGTPISVGSVNWELIPQTEEWVSLQTTTGFVTYDISATFDGEEENTVKRIGIQTLTLNASATEHDNISASLLVTAVPIHTDIFTHKHYYTFNEPVSVFNVTQKELLQDYVSAFIWDDGINTIKTTSFDEPFVMSYDVPGVYSLNVTIVMNDYQTVKSQFTDVFNIVSEFEMYDQDIYRIFGPVKIDLPYHFHQVKMPPNEWVTADNINLCMQKLIDNYNYLNTASKIYNPTPTGLIGWYGLDEQKGEKWHTRSSVVQTNYDNFGKAVSGGLLENALDIRVNQKDWYIIADNNYIKIVQNDYNGTLISETDRLGPNDLFGIIPSVDLDSKDRIFVLDPDNLRVVVLNYDENYKQMGKCGPWQFINAWGGFGGSRSMYGFQNPVDMFIADDVVYVLDNKNQIIKKYTTAGAFINSIKNDEFKDGISLTVDIDNNIYILKTNNTILKMDKDGQVIKTLSYPDKAHGKPRKIRRSYDNGFLYICQKERIVKITIHGGFAGVIGEFIEDIEPPFEVGLPKIYNEEDFSGTVLEVPLNYEIISVYINGIKQTEETHYIVNIISNEIIFNTSLNNDSVAVDVKEVLRYNDYILGDTMVLPIGLKNDNKTEIYINGLRQTHQLDYNLLLDLSTGYTDLVFNQKLDNDHITVIVRDPSSILYILPGRDYQSIYSHNDGRLYISNVLSIVKYTDNINYYNLKRDVKKRLWPNDALKIKKDEYVEAWVYNKIFARFYDNLEIFKRSIYMVPVKSTTLDGFEIITPRKILHRDFQPLKYKKQDIYIGANELVTPNVINRCLNQLFNNQKQLLGLVQEIDLATYLEGKTDRKIKFPLIPIFKSKTVVTEGQEIILEEMPYRSDVVAVYINGVRQIPDIDYTLSGRYITFNFSNNDKVTVDYIYFSSYFFERHM